MRGNAIVSRTCSSPQTHATQRSMPMPNPPCGTVPYLRRSMYQSNASLRQLMFFDAPQQQFGIVDSLAAADDLAIAFGREHIHAQRDFRPIRIGRHVERLDRGRETIHHDGPVELLRQDGFVGAAEIAAPLNFGAVLLQILHRVVIAHAREGRLHRFELRDIAFQNLQLFAALVENAARRRKPPSLRPRA